MSYKKIFGCAAFGLADQVLQVKGKMSAETFFCADAVLPTHPLGTIQTGDLAEKERIDSGLYWPPEARVHLGNFLRRAPISCVWRGLVEAGDRLAQWQVGQGVSFFLSRIISKHVVDLLEKSGCMSRDDVVLAIPDALDEFGQDALLRDLKIYGFKNVQLLWRPVAAALSWLSELGQNAFDLNPAAKEHIIVVYLGADGVEMNSFQLYRKKSDDGVFVIPVRERPRDISPVTGFDWAANALDAAFPGMDDGAFWQAFTDFPHVWEAMAERSYSEGEVWSQKDHWTFWNPDETLRNCVLQASASPNTRLRGLLAKSCRLFTVDSAQKEYSAMENLAKLFATTLNSPPQPSSRLRGIIVAGPLCPPRLPQWILSAEGKLQAAGITSTSPFPKLDTIWLSHGKNALVDGCAEYGRRLDLKLPTYLDTLPHLSVLVEQRGKHIWVDLLKAETCEGGKPYKPDPIQGKFGIKAGAQHLQVYLKKDNLGGRVFPGTQEKFTEEKMRAEVDDKVRRAGTYEEVLKVFANDDGGTGQYARILAKKLFGNPFRRAKFVFPSVPEENMPVNVSVEIRPASGFAQIILHPSKPGDTAFLRGRRIFLDYSTMEETDPPPPPDIGWPELIKIEVDPSAAFLVNNNFQIQNYLQTTPQDILSGAIVDEIKYALTEPTNIKTNEGFEQLRPIDQDGMAGTEKASQMVDALALKAAKDLPHVKPGDRRKFITIMSWLFAKTPDNMKQGIRQYLSQGYCFDWNCMIDAAGRAFTTPGDYKIFYSEILKRINSTHTIPFTIQCSRALCRLLSLRENSPLSMTRLQAKAFTGKAVNIMEKEALSDNYKQKFFQAARLFLFLLRFRIVEPDFLDPDNSLDSDLFERTLDCLHKAVGFFSHSSEPGADRAKKIVIGIEKFMRYEGSDGILIFNLDKMTGGN